MSDFALAVRYFSSSSGMTPSNVPPYFCEFLPARQVKVMCSLSVPHSQMRRCSSVSSPHGRFEQVAVAEAELAVHRLGDAGVDVPLPAAEVVPGADELDGAGGERLRRIGDELRGVEAEHVAQAVARGAHALRAVEAEQLRRRRLEAEAAGVAGVVGAEGDVAGVGRCACCGACFGVAWTPVRRRRRPASSSSASRSAAASRLTVAASCGASASSSATMRLPSPSLRPSSTASARRVRIVGAGDEAVDHHFDVVPHLAVERQVVGELHDAAVDPGADEALLQQVLEQVAELALLPADDRREDRELRLGRQRFDAADDLLAALGGDRPRRTAGSGPARRGRRARAGSRRSR